MGPTELTLLAMAAFALLLAWKGSMQGFSKSSFVFCLHANALALAAAAFLATEWLLDVEALSRSRELKYDEIEVPQLGSVSEVENYLEIAVHYNKLGWLVAVYLRPLIIGLAVLVPAVWALRWYFRVYLVVMPLRLGATSRLGGAAVGAVASLCWLSLFGLFLPMWSEDFFRGHYIKSDLLMMSGWPARSVVSFIWEAKLADVTILILR